MEEAKPNETIEERRVRISQGIRDGNLNYDHTYPGGAYYNPLDDRHYNNWGQQLRHISEYNPHSEGYTPFGDE